MELSDKVRRRREELQLTQEELALRMGYKSRVSINKIENGRPVTQKIIVRLAEALDVSVPYLMGWDETPAEELRGMGAMAAELLMEPATVEMLQDYRSLSAGDQATVRALVAALAAKSKKD